MQVNGRCHPARGKADAMINGKTRRTGRPLHGVEGEEEEQIWVEFTSVESRPAALELIVKVQQVEFVYQENDWVRSRKLAQDSTSSTKEGCIVRGREDSSQTIGRCEMQGPRRCDKEGLIYGQVCEIYVTYEAGRAPDEMARAACREVMVRALSPRRTTGWTIMRQKCGQMYASNAVIVTERQGGACTSEKGERGMPR